jgi:hypothetical protein
MLLAVFFLLGSSSTIAFQRNPPALPLHLLRRTSIHAALFSLQGLTDDGDFALLGINIDDAQSSSSPRDASGSTTDSSLLQSLLGGVSKSSEAPILQQSTPPPVVVTPTQSSFPRTHNVHLEQLERLEGWLLDMIPTLHPGDVEHYAAGLAEIGFDPECESRFELLVDDLSFMKLLHRRFVYNEVTSTT